MNKFDAVLTRVFKLSADQIHDELSKDDIPSWDSMNGLVVIYELEKEFGIKFQFSEVMGMKSIGDIKRALEQHGITLEDNNLDQS